MTQWHGDKKKRKMSGGRKRLSRGKRSFEMGKEAIETELGSRAQKVVRSRGGNTKIKLVKEEYANVTSPSSKRTERAKIIQPRATPWERFTYNSKTSLPSKIIPMINPGQRR